MNHLSQVTNTKAFSRPPTSPHEIDRACFGSRQGTKAHQTGRAWPYLVLVVILISALVSFGYSRRIGSTDAGGEKSAGVESRDAGAAYVVGDLGGRPVRIPSSYVSLVEYEGDPTWGEATRLDRPQRSQSSRLTSFGLDMLYPEMTVATTDELRNRKAAAPLRTTNWLSIGVLSGDRFGLPGPVNRIATAYLKEGIGVFRFEPSATPLYGLTAYSPAGTDASTGKPYRDHRDAETLYVHRDSSGQPDVLIQCANRPNLEAAPCKHQFSLEPEMKVLVYVHYRRGMLSEWASIQRSVSKQIVEFTVPSISDPVRK